LQAQPSSREKCGSRAFKQTQRAAKVWRGGLQQRARSKISRDRSIKFADHWEQHGESAHLKLGGRCQVSVAWQFSNLWDVGVLPAFQLLISSVCYLGQTGFLDAECMIPSAFLPIGLAALWQLCGNHLRATHISA